MINSRILSAALAAFLLFFNVLSYADTIQLKDGIVFEGVMLKEEDNAITIKVKAGEHGFLENEYMKSDIELIKDVEGIKIWPAQEKEEGLAKDENGPSSDEEAAAQVVYYDENYLQDIEGLTVEVNYLKSKWDSGVLNYEEYSGWVNKFKDLAADFKNKYSEFKLMSYSYMALAFLEMKHFGSYFCDIDTKAKEFKDYADKDLPENIKAALQDEIRQYHDSAGSSICSAIDHLLMAKEKVLKK